MRFADPCHGWAVGERGAIFAFVDPTGCLSSAPSDKTPAALTGYGITRTFAARSKGGSIVSAARKRRKKVKVGGTVKYTLSEPATVTFTVERLTKGRNVKRGKKRVCVRPTRKNKKKRKCVRATKLRGSFSRVSKAGRNSFKFSGRLRGRKLKPGNYRLVATAKDLAGNVSKPKRKGFRIVKR
jgi:hypothetical protein